jgi:hypothetical protein
MPVQSGDWQRIETSKVQRHSILITLTIVGLVATSVYGGEVIWLAAAGVAAIAAQKQPVLPVPDPQCYNPTFWSASS